MATVTASAIPPTRRHERLDPRAVEGAGIVLCDLDGCLMSEGRLFAETAEFAEACGARLRVVSNRSDTTAAALSAQLSELGILVPAAHILLAGEFTLEHFARQGLRRVRLCAAPVLVERALALGLAPNASDPEVVLLCRDPGQNVDTLGPVLTRIARGAQLWVANEDVSHPDQSGEPVAETGALLAALLAIHPGLSWRSLGKPHAAMLTHALSAAGVGADEAIFVGDNAQTDGRAAAAAGMPFIHIRRRSER